MGKNNRARRAAKAKARAKERAQRPQAGGGGERGFDPFRGGSSQGDRGFDPFQGGGGPRRTAGTGDRELFGSQAERARWLWVATLQARYDKDRFETQGLAALGRMSPEFVSTAAEALALEQLDHVWQHGWQPAEVLRHVRMRAGAPGARLVTLAVANDHASRRLTTLQERWVNHIESLDLPAADSRAGWLRRWATSERLDWPNALNTTLHTLECIGFLPVLDPILPPPGSVTDPRAQRGGEIDPVLERVRNLLAKAESTTFEAEAMAFTAKAQELMTRHALDTAMLASKTGDRETPFIIRIPIDPPYADAKSLLLQYVGEAQRCRTMWFDSLAMSTVVGFADDLNAVEMLFTSLLVQAQSALAEAGKGSQAGARTRSQRFRTSFLSAYSERIRERLKEINEAVIAEHSADKASYLPVLRSRTAAIDDYITERFGELRSDSVRRGYDQAGWAHGRLAADNAQLSFGEIVDGDAPDAVPKGLLDV